MKHLRVAALAVAVVLAETAARAADFSGSLTSGATAVGRTMLPASQGLNGRTSLMIVSADAAGSASVWCTFKANITPGPGVPGSFEIVAGAAGFDRQIPANIPQVALVCAAMPNTTSNITIEANQ